MSRPRESVTSRVEAALARIAAENPSLRAAIGVLPVRALRDAAASDARLQSGHRRGPLDGLTLGVKDNLAVNGEPRSCGIGALAAALQPEDAQAVARMREAGAIPLSRLNMDEAAMSGSGDNPHFGRCGNPRDAGLSPGGSSAGSGAAVAARWVDLALGTDTLGSVRLPAAFCGVWGFLPSPGLVGRSGLAFASPEFDRIGVLARDADLLWPALLALTGLDARDPRSRSAPPHWPEEVRGLPDLRGKLLGIPDQIAETPMDAGATRGWTLAQETARKLGAELRQLRMPGWRPAALRQAGLKLVARQAGEFLLGRLGLAEAQLSPALVAVLASGREVVGETETGFRREIEAAGTAIGEAEQHCDALMLPTAAQRAFPHGATAPYPPSIFTVLASLTGRPALSLPVALPGEVLPAALQIVGPDLGDAQMLSIALSLRGKLRAASL